MDMYAGEGANKYATAEQKGKAAERRDDYTGEERRHLNWIVHSGDKNPHKRGFNPYADRTNSYDKKHKTSLINTPKNDSTGENSNLFKFKT
jgi:hypothetical protein